MWRLCFFLGSGRGPAGDETEYLDDDSKRKVTEEVRKQFKQLYTTAGTKDKQFDFSRPGADIYRNPDS